MWAPGGAPGPVGWDRRRVGARLRAALAGLHELQGLRARQQARVRGALAMQPRSAPAAPRGPRAHEQRLEAALAALQEQLVRSTRRGRGGARGSGHRVQVQAPRGGRCDRLRGALWGFGCKRVGGGGPRRRALGLHGLCYFPADRRGCIPVGLSFRAVLIRTQ